MLSVNILRPESGPSHLAKSGANFYGEGYVFTPVCQSFCSQGGQVHGGGACVAGVGERSWGGGGVRAIRSVSGRYASYWNAFLFYGNTTGSTMLDFF